MSGRSARSRRRRTIRSGHGFPERTRADPTTGRSSLKKNREQVDRHHPQHHGKVALHPSSQMKVLRLLGLAGQRSRDGRTLLQTDRSPNSLRTGHPFPRVPNSPSRHLRGRTSLHAGNRMRLHGPNRRQPIATADLTPPLRIHVLSKVPHTTLSKWPRSRPT